MNFHRCLSKLSCKPRRSMAGPAFVARLQALLSLSAAPPAGYALQASLGYVYTTDIVASGSQQNLAYEHDGVGNIEVITDSLWGTGSRSFQYDGVNRLIQASGFFGPGQTEKNCTYVYNPIGNIIDKCGVTFEYTDINHPSAVTRISTGKTYAYDANGNMFEGAGRTFTWNADNRVTGVSIGGSTTRMDYDYSGVRVKKDGAGGITHYPFQGYEIAPDGEITKLIRIGGETFAAKRGTNKLFYHNDHLGGVNVITDAGGVRCQLNEYDPWGTVSKQEGTCDQKRAFTGKELDAETGLYYYGGRYYDPEISRFVSPDPFVGDPEDPQNLNRYSYVINNPQNYIDPSGYFHRHKKSGGFFSIFSSIFRIVFSIVAIINGIPPVWEGASMAFGVANLIHATIDLARNLPGSDGIGSPGTGNVFSGIPTLAQQAGGGGYFSPSLMLAARAGGCDVCSESSLEWLIPLFGRVLIDRLTSERVQVAQATTDSSKKRSTTIGKTKFECEGENVPCRVEFPKRDKLDSLRVDQKVDPQCEQCKTDGRMPEKGCNVLQGTCDASGVFSESRRTPPPRGQTASELLQIIIDNIFGGGKGAAED